MGHLYSLSSQEHPTLASTIITTWYKLITTWYKLTISDSCTFINLLYPLPVFLRLFKGDDIFNFLFYVREQMWKCKAWCFLLSSRYELLKHFRLHHRNYEQRQQYPWINIHCPCTFKSWNTLHIHFVVTCHSKLSLHGK